MSRAFPASRARDSRHERSSVCSSPREKRATGTSQRTRRSLSATSPVLTHAGHPAASGTPSRSATSRGKRTTSAKRAARTGADPSPQTHVLAYLVRHDEQMHCIRSSLFRVERDRPMPWLGPL